MTNPNARQEDIQKLAEMIKDIRVAMFTTAMPDGALRSRPMYTQEAEFDGELWFFTSRSSPKADEIQQDQQVNVSYAKPDDQLYVSVSGRAQVLRDEAKMKELYSPMVKAWFPDGLEDPDLALIRVQVEQAEYWDSPSSKMVQLFGLVKAVTTGHRLSPQEAGENEKINLA